MGPHLDSHVFAVDGGEHGLENLRRVVKLTHLATRHR